MPIVSTQPIVSLSQAEFGELAFAVMEQVFAIHNEFGRFFDERTYKRELAARMPGVELEVGVELRHGDFCKMLYADAIVNSGGLFEFKAVDELNAKHRAQCMQYLILFGLEHGKLINVRPEKVKHEFVNYMPSDCNLKNPIIQCEHWDSHQDGADAFRDILVSVIRDWGSGLLLYIYEEALTHLLGGEALVTAEIPVYGTCGLLSTLRMRTVAPNIAFKITAFGQSKSSFVAHARKLIQHTSLQTILWANIGRDEIHFMTIR